MCVLGVCMIRTRPVDRWGQFRPEPSCEHGLYYKTATATVTAGKRQRYVVVLYVLLDYRPNSNYESGLEYTNTAALSYSRV